jgi:hypothetical protein
MSTNMQDLRAVMEAADAGTGPADRLELIRRRVKRTRRVQLTAGAAATAITLGAVFALMPGLGGETTPAVTMTGSAASGYPQTLQGLPLVKAVKYDRLRERAKLTIMPTATTTIISLDCDQPVMIFSETRNIPSSTSCLGSAPGHGFQQAIETEAGVPLTVDLVALPQAEAVQRDPQRIDKIALKGGPTPGTWSVGVYSGTCARWDCLPPRRGPSDQTTEMKQLANTQGIADSQKKTVQFTPTSGRVRLRLVCLEGAGWVATWQNGKLSSIRSCGEAGAAGFFWDTMFDPGKATDLQFAIFPASTERVGTAAGIDEAMKHPDPKGTWTLQVYDDQS